MLFIHKIQWNKREEDTNIIQTANTIKKKYLNVNTVAVSRE